MSRPSRPDAEPAAAKAVGLGSLPAEATALLKRLNRVSGATYERASLRTEAERLRAHGPTPVSSFWSIAGNPDQMKGYMHEIRGILAIFIGEVWALLEPLDDRRSGSEIATLIAGGMPPIDAICAHCFRSFQNAAARWDEAMAGRKDALYERLAQFTDAFRRHVEQRGGTLRDRNPGAAIARGGMTGTRIVVGLVEVIPRVWQRRSGGAIPPEVLERTLTAEAFAPLLSVWKGMKGEVVNPYERRSTERHQPIEPGLTRYVFKPEAFDLARSTGGVHIPIPSREGVEAAEAQGALPISAYRLRGSCPADSAFAPSVHGDLPAGASSVISEATEWIIRLARTHWLPTLRAP